MTTGDTGPVSQVEQTLTRFVGDVMIQYRTCDGEGDREVKALQVSR